MRAVISVDEAMGYLADGMSIMVGGFLGVGAPNALIDAVHGKGVRDITLILNDADLPGRGVGKLVASGQVKKAIVSHIGMNPEAGKRMNAGEMEVELIPQGTMSERMRCAGAGLGGVLTKTGVGTVVAEGKQVIESDGCEYLLEKPLAGDVALVKAHIADRAGNLVFRKAAKNFNPLMAMSGRTVIVEAANLVEVGELDPDDVMIPGVFVDYIVQA